SNIKFGFEQCQRHGHAVTGNGFGYTDNMRSDAGVFEAKECSGASTTGLNVVDNEENVMVASQTTQLLSPFGACGAESAFTLDGFDNNGRWFVHAGAGVFQYAL